MPNITFGLKNGYFGPQEDTGLKRVLKCIELVRAHKTDAL